MRFRFQNWRVLLVGAALAAITLAVYWPALTCNFINYDDNKYVTENPYIRAGLTLDSLRWALTSPYAANWHPLTWLSHIVDCQLFGLTPQGDHLVNLVFHIANSLLLFGVLKRMTGALWRSAVVAALFALHPLHVESVAWVAERKDVLSTFFFLLTLGTYAKYVTRVEGRGSREGEVQNATASTVHGSTFGSSTFHPPSSFFYVLALFLFALGLMSKPMLVTLPFVLLLLDCWPLRRFDLSTIHYPLSTLRRLLFEKLPFFALSIISALSR